MPNNEVDAWFDAYRHPQKDQMQRLRKAILAVDARIEECIKWSCPTFTYRGNLVSFNPRATKKISLQFHRGAEIPGRFAHLDGSGKLGRNMSIADLDDLNT